MAPQFGRVVVVGDHRLAKEDCLVCSHTHTHTHTQHTHKHTHTHTHLFLHVTELVSKATWVPWSSGTHSLMSGVSEYSIVHVTRTCIHYQDFLSLHPSPPCLLSDLLQNAVLPAVQYKTPFHTDAYLNLRHYG